MEGADRVSADGAGGSREREGASEASGGGAPRALNSAGGSREREGASEASRGGAPRV